MKLTHKLELKRCPHCNVADSNIIEPTNFETNAANGGNQRIWKIYVCQSCGGVIVGSRNMQFDTALELFPESRTVEDCIPERARLFLQQSIETVHAPSGSIMLSASSIDSMLKDKGYKGGSLYSRIDQAAKGHLITQGMSEWVHQIRLEANDQRHADENSSLPTQDDAKRIVEFAFPLAEFLYVLRNRVNKGIENTKKE